MDFLADFGNINFAARNMVLDHIKLNVENTQVANSLSMNGGGFDFKIRNLGLNFLFKYDMISLPL